MLIIPDLMRVMDLQQEAAGAGAPAKGIASFTAWPGPGRRLFLATAPSSLPRCAQSRFSCFATSKTLAGRLAHWMSSKGVSEKVHVRTFHSWCHSQLRAYNIKLPQSKEAADQAMAEMVETVIREVDRGHIPSAQYEAVLIDEGHDFKPDWLKLVVQGFNRERIPCWFVTTPSQSTRLGGRKISASRASASRRRAERPSAKVNYRNTQEILEFATQFAGELLKAKEAEEDGIPRLMPIPRGATARPPIIVKLPTLKSEGEWIAERLKECTPKTCLGGDMANLYRHYDPCADKTVRAESRRAGIPNTWKDDVSFGEHQDTVKGLLFHIQQRP